MKIKPILLNLNSEELLRVTKILIDDDKEGALPFIKILNLI
jgi:hypothetical protein